MSPAAEALPASSYSITNRPPEGREVFPLHLGDTWRLPPAGCRLEDLAAARHPDLYRYALPGGLAELVDVLVERARAETGVAVERPNVLVTAGATGGFAAVLGALVRPGDEVLLLSPRWPLVAGLVKAFGGVPVEVPFHRAAGPEGIPTTAEEAVSAVTARTGERTAALYFNSPNNPTGDVLPRSWIEALVEWARREGLWILADEAYRDFTYGPSAAASTVAAAEAVDAFGLAPERTFAFRSFSKSFGMAGNRCGWVMGPLPAMTAALKVATQLVYSAPTGAQLSALAALTRAEGLEAPGEAWLKEAREQYRDTGARAAARLGVAAPLGATFLFLDVAAELGGEPLLAFLRRAADRGLLLSPGTSFGPYPASIRLCFSAAPPEVVLRGTELLCELLGR
ncbi:MAG TPA: pyridoxal phosphate-dependent aminotransferase [Thermoanaerobaculia bacterium]